MAAAIALGSGIIGTVGETFVYSYATGQQAGHTLLDDVNDVRPDGTARSLTFEGTTQLHGCDLSASVTSQFSFSGNHILASGAGSACSDVINSEPGCDVPDNQADLQGSGGRSRLGGSTA